MNRLAKKLQRFFLQQLSQELQQLDCSQQAGSQQAGCSQQAASQQAGCSQQAASQHVGWQQLLQQPRSNRPRSLPNRPHLWLQQELQQLGSQQAGSQQAGCSQQAASQQAGCSQQVGSQQLVSQQDDWQQPPLLRPNIRVSRSKPKLWLHRPRLTTSAPTNMFHFIEQRLLYMELGRNACPSLASPRRQTLFASSLVREGLAPRPSTGRVAADRVVVQSLVGSVGRIPQFTRLWLQVRRAIPWLD
ncbi:MAG TPA: hypothetical protein VG826_36015 [Pirellulales bacterium]|nr:hypothetical protein [Pirellulales bacterium]